MIYLDDALKKATQALNTESSTARLDAELLLSDVLGVNRVYLYAHGNTVLTGAQIKRFNDLVAKRMQGEPIAYILGKKEFWSREFIVTKDTLVPRPETELLIEMALETLDQNASLSIADLGTGTGAIALTLALECPAWEVSATDISEKALQVAKSNANALSKQVNFYQGNWLAALPDKQYDVIISNPPYIAEDDSHLSDKQLNFEPQHALVSGANGLDAIPHIIRQARDYLADNGWLLLEHGVDQAANVMALFLQSNYTEVVTKKDLAGCDRVTMGRIVAL